ncbi:MAG: thioredoxin 1 [Halobacteriales archaeon]|jgi:thioredoxin 1
MPMETMQPTPTWDPDAHEAVVRRFSALRDRMTVRVWGADWCPDCRTQLPDFAAALSAAVIPDERIETYPVDRDKHGELVEAYDIEYIPTIVIEIDGDVVARFVESGERSAAEELADQLAATVEIPETNE